MSSIVGTRLSSSIPLRTLPEETPYRYETLSSGTEFRLLKLKAGPGKDIACSIHHHHVGAESCPSYRALSYTWGHGSPRYHIQMLGGSILKIRKNLRNALLALRDDKSDSYVWIDAVCINQDSDLERNHQVKLMAQIYGNANVVVAWLESANERVDIAGAFDFFQTTTSAPHDIAITSEQLREQARRDRELEYNRRLLTDFCNLKYWSRKWIIQEILTARTVVLQAGKATCPISDMEKFFDRLKDDTQWSPISTQLLSTAAARLAIQRSKGSENRLLYDLIESYAESQCQMPCDHVYALCNLTVDDGAQRLVDYTSPPVDLLCGVLDFVQQYEDLPPGKAPAFADLLRELLQIARDDLGANHALLSRYATPVSVTVLPLHMEEESTASGNWRRVVTPLEPIASVSLNSSGHDGWVEMTGRTEDPNPVGRLDMAHFRIPGSQYGGLAACRLQPEDRIWYLLDTNLVFIVRPISATAVRIIGRAIVSELGPDPSNQQNEDSLRRKSPLPFLRSNAPHDQPLVYNESWRHRPLDFSKIPQQQQIAHLTYGTLLDLVSLAKEVGNVIPPHRNWTTRSRDIERRTCGYFPTWISRFWRRRTILQKWLIACCILLAFLLVVILPPSIILATRARARNAKPKQGTSQGSSSDGGCGSCCFTLILLVGIVAGIIFFGSR